MEELSAEVEAMNMGALRSALAASLAAERGLDKSGKKPALAARLLEARGRGCGRSARPLPTGAAEKAEAERAARRARKAKAVAGEALACGAAREVGDQQPDEGLETGAAEASGAALAQLEAIDEAVEAGSLTLEAAIEQLAAMRR
ncbi:hypothetical protein EMIHUDRAFT_247416 [Emiliania huxleyi CCMP1516]|uniref:SAP domain-containing protein n=2 Tax=Emiliania huxleyi TaxID=2903 RepID=A0A0D3IMN1_EMIH1|nr:hypothetical protein EMIHUDRAFT_247416 [Emiliania huxleyi CCMP1516]EOD12516.1 hypothetical protein EMIHUDRAFT_247416 [Emiliania huxleyi CCMP1516]|eukprot:XP_005764945.1 hypothetical protein EMIHUDRAFT_247416 [Emiliania huxleyi CCMP1516]